MQIILIGLFVIGVIFSLTAWGLCKLLKWAYNKITGNTSVPRPATVQAAPAVAIRKGIQWNKIFEFIFKLVIVAGVVTGVIWLVLGHINSLVTEHAKDAQDEYVTEHDPTAYWWTCSLKNEYGKEMVTPCSWCEFTKWTNEEVCFQYEIESESGHYVLYNLKKGEKGEWHGTGKNKYAGWFKLGTRDGSDFPFFDGSIKELKGQFNNDGVGHGDPGTIELVRGRLKTPEEKVKGRVRLLYP